MKRQTLKKALSRALTIFVCTAVAGCTTSPPRVVDDDPQGTASGSQAPMFTQYPVELVALDGKPKVRIPAAYLTDSYGAEPSAGGIVGGVCFMRHQDRTPSRRARYEELSNRGGMQRRMSAQHQRERADLKHTKGRPKSTSVCNPGQFGQRKRRLSGGVADKNGLLREA